GIANSHNLFLVDNMAIVLSFARGRCKNYVVLQQIRRFRALCLIHNIRPHFRWIKSEFNPADAPSRDGGEPGPQRSHCQVEGRGQADRPPGAAQASGGRVRAHSGLRPPAHGPPPAAGQSQAVGRRALGISAPMLLRQWPVPKPGSLSVEVVVTGPLFVAARAEAGAGQDRGEVAVAAESADSNDLDAVARCERGRSKYLMDARRAMGQLGALRELEVGQPKTREYYYLPLDGTLCILKAELFLSEQPANVGRLSLPRLLCYLGPSKLLGVKGGHFVASVGGVSRHWSRLLAPEELGIPTKVGAVNDGLQLGTMEPKWLDVVWRGLSAAPATQRVCPFSYQDLSADVQTVSVTRGWRLVPYQHRHDKASHDRQRQLRGLPEVMMRDQGRKFKSVTRYPE
ncbi:unnamed protein product, partial [Prorocentrum cordatum]